jgi:hypothetical protein
MKYTKVNYACIIYLSSFIANQIAQFDEDDQFSPKLSGTVGNSVKEQTSDKKVRLL